MTEREMVRCENCLGMGYKGRMRPSGWKIGTCSSCEGRGQVAAKPKRAKASKHATK